MKKNLLFLCFAILTPLVSSISTASTMKRDNIKKRVPCETYYDYINFKSFNVCNNDPDIRYGYYPNKEVNYYPTNRNTYNYETYDKLKNWLSSISYTSPKLISTDYRYQEKVSKEIHYYNFLFPKDIESSKRPIITDINNSLWSTSSFVEINFETSYETATTSSLTLTAGLKVALGTSAAKIEVSGSASWLVSHYNSTTTTTSIKYHFDNHNFENNKLYQFRVVDKTYYVPVLVQELFKCSETKLCKGVNGSYIGKEYYVLIPVGIKTFIRAFKTESQILFDNDYGEVGTLNSFSEPHIFLSKDELFTNNYLFNNFYGNN